MRSVSLLLALGMLSACSGEKPELFSAYCEDGSHIVATKERAESFCLRRRGVRQIEPFQPTDEEPAK